MGHRSPPDSPLSNQGLAGGGRDEMTERNRWADEARTQTARGYTLYAEWREAQFSFTSRLPGEPAAGVNDIHYTPGAPRSLLGSVVRHF